MFLQFSWQILGSWNLLAVELVASQVLCHWPKNNSPVGKVSTIRWIFFKFPITWLQQLLVSDIHCMGYNTVLKHHTSWQMFVPLPANSLMKSARHVTAYVHFRCWISKNEYKADESCSTEYRCHSLPAYWHTSHFVAVNEDRRVHCIKAHFE